MPHILIVEDEPTTSWALAEGLSDDGYTIDTFRTAEEALVWLRAHRSDIVITDFRLPGLSGLELAQKLSRGRHAQPVIVVTAYGSPETVRELVRAGVSEVFPKPFHVDELRRAVHRALLSRRERRSPRAGGTRAKDGSGTTPLRKAA
jgi:DNA-binding NtrC family response regulator